MSRGMEQCVLRKRGPLVLLRRLLRKVSSMVSVRKVGSWGFACLENKVQRMLRRWGGRLLIQTPCLSYRWVRVGVDREKGC